MPDLNDEFFVGYDDKVPPTIAEFVRRAVIVILVAAAIVPIVLVIAQQPFAKSTFEYTTVSDFEGIIKSDPYPRLVVARPGKTAAGAELSSYALVSPGKHGADEDTRAASNRTVQLKGKLIHREGEVAIEVVPGSLIAIENTTAASPDIAPVEAAATKLIGEIVDTKCYLGVMNPGETKPHRACAVRCISGGIPPMFVAREPAGRAHHLLITSSDGKPVNETILPFVGIPVEVTGRIEQFGPVSFLRLAGDPIPTPR